MRQPALIFDFGNVIAYFDYVRATTKLGARLGLSGADLYDRLGPLGFVAELQNFERGQLSAVEFSSRITRMIQVEISHEDFVAAWSDIFAANEPLIPLIADLKDQGYCLILGSNTNLLHASHFRERFASTLRHFDHLVLSYEIGHLKPAPEFFRACAQAARMSPADCVFIDDLAENVDGARAVGLVGIVYRSTTTLIHELKRLGITTRYQPMIFDTE